MEKGMKEAGSKIPDMIEALKKAGWEIYEHHDNWIKSEDRNKPDVRYLGKSINEAYKELQCN